MVPEPTEIHADASVATLMPEPHVAAEGALTPAAVGGAGERDTLPLRGAEDARIEDPDAVR